MRRRAQRAPSLARTDRIQRRRDAVDQLAMISCETARPLRQSQRFMSQYLPTRRAQAAALSIVEHRAARGYDGSWYCTAVMAAGVRGGGSGRRRPGAVGVMVTTPPVVVIWRRMSSQCPQSAGIRLGRVRGWPRRAGWALCALPGAASFPRRGLVLGSQLPARPRLLA